MTFQNEIVQWYAVHKRALPWRNTSDAYVIWLSEIILQQTRVEQGLPYFSRFLENFPTVKDFAAASEEQILKLWQGLGYYSRGRNMLFTARQVMEQHHGIFPVTYSELVLLKGIGTYTASAIASFSSGEARAVLDGNVFRVLARYFGIATPIDTPAGKKQFGELAGQLLEGQNPSVYNQAIMEFGALLCKPKNPDCRICPVNTGCYALKNNLANKLPAKEKKLKKRDRWFNYFLCINNGEILLRLREAGDIWQGLYDLPLIELDSVAGPGNPSWQTAVENNFGTDTVRPLHKLKHLLTHQTIFIQFFALDNFNVNFNKQKNWQWVALSDLEKRPMPIVIHDFLKTLGEKD